MNLDVGNIRKDFPILSQKIYGKSLVYLDNAATTQKPLSVIQKINKIYTSINSNVHRGVHYLSQLTTNLYEETRKIVQNYINASNSSEIVFTRGTTESINLLASSFCRSQCCKEDEIILTVMEHHANIVPWQIQSDIIGIKIKVIPITEIGEVQLENIEHLISSKTKLIAVTSISNVLGTINPVADIIRLGHSYGIPVMVDAAQSVQHMKTDVKLLDCDFMVFSSHKMYGATGVGVLYAKENWLDKLPPYQGGGEMITNVTFKKTTFNKLPLKFEAGTPDYVGVIAFGEAIRYIESVGLNNIYCYEQKLLNYATEKLMQIPKLKIFGTSYFKSSIISFLVDDIHYYDMGVLLDQFGIAVRTGHHCAQPLMNALGIDGTVRASFAFYNTKSEIDILVNAVRHITSIFRAKQKVKTQFY
ncbi:MAG: SufS family cysteine desulfurase [Bacteroidales bacterium OttesenSCG-928-I14]|nr:SufS family cysteine desulfurase [Bacteroidales bacterium OttesenSCG-928-I14]